MTYSIIHITERPDLKDAAAQWFHQKWHIPAEAYRQSMEESFSAGHVVPHWYLVLKEDMLIGGCGVIDNDFHDRKDLSPNLCALFVEPEYRGKGIAGKLLDHVCRDMAAKGVDALYLITDHTSFYERYGWKYLCEVNCEGEARKARLYGHTFSGPMLETERLLLRP